MQQNTSKVKVKSATNHDVVIYLMRHGKTEWNAKGRLQGRLDSPLLPDSIKILRKMGKLLKNHNISAVYSSPLERCRQSAKIISENIKLPIMYCDELMECDHGKCEGLTLDEAKKDQPDFFKDREMNGKWDIRWPGGESYADVASRIGHMLTKIDFSVTTLIIAHETVNKIILGLLLNLSHDEIMLIKQKNTEIYVIDVKRNIFDIIDCHQESVSYFG